VNPSAVLPIAAHRLLGDLRTHDRSTYAHSLAVGRYAARLCTALDAPAAFVAHAQAVGTMHDVGKLHIPLHILNAPRALSDDEARVMREHADLGSKLIEGDDSLDHLVLGVRYHHERLDGFGYPHALRGEEIPEEARIVAVADTFDALTRGRPYRPPITVSQALCFLSAAAGRQLEPHYVATFIHLIEAEGPERVHGCATDVA
jgi:HD-GYP domain-containing protein (c-di-GMP phosphodiesterase class II)